MNVRTRIPGWLCYKPRKRIYGSYQISRNAVASCGFQNLNGISIRDRCLPERVTFTLSSVCYQAPRHSPESLISQLFPVTINDHLMNKIFSALRMSTASLPKTYKVWAFESKGADLTQKDVTLELPKPGEVGRSRNYAVHALLTTNARYSSRFSPVASVTQTLMSSRATT